MPQTSSHVRVLIADDDPIVRELIRKILTRRPDFQILGEAVDGQETLRRIGQLRPDVLLLDLLMPRLQGLEALHAIAKGNVPVAVIILAASITKLQSLEAIQLGARGVLAKKNVRKLPECIACVVNGGYWVEDQSFAGLQDAVMVLIQQPGTAEVSNQWKLTPRELQVIALVSTGSTNRNVATTLNISEETVKRHLTNIFEKCGVANRVELVRFATDHSLLVAEAVSAPLSD